VVLCPPDTVGGVDVRGPSPGSRETALLASDKKISEVHAVVLTGGSAFGLATADGVMRWLEAHEIGHWTPIALVPIVPAAVVYDLFLGGGKKRPDAEMGHAACEAALAGPQLQGNVGAGAGVTVGKWGGFEGMMKGGFGAASLTLETTAQGSPQTETGELVVAACAVTNSVGDVVNADGSVLAGARAPEGGWQVALDSLRRSPDRPPTLPGTNTTLVVIATNALMTKAEANRLAQRGHDGLAIAIRPAHTSYDGDTCFALASGQVPAPYDLVANATVKVVAEAIRNSVRAAASVGGVPGLAG
jgi:L-aminopeptidase/D-esterase-like protein